MCGAVVRENFNFRLKVVGMGMLAPSQERVHIRAYKPSRVELSASDCCVGSAGPRKSKIRRYWPIYGPREATYAPPPSNCSQHLEPLTMAEGSPITRDNKRMMVQAFSWAGCDM